MKTAMQELIEQLQIEINNCEEQGLKYRGIYLDAKWKAEILLEKEKEQIINAIKETSTHGEAMAEEQSNRYYNETFNNHEKH